MGIKYVFKHVNQTCTFNSNFKFVKLSRKRSRDKPWVASAVKESSKIKNKLYKKLILTKNKDDECACKRYKQVHNRVSAEAPVARNNFVTKTLEYNVYLTTTTTTNNNNDRLSAFDPGQPG